MAKNVLCMLCRYAVFRAVTLSVNNSTCSTVGNDNVPLVIESALKCMHILPSVRCISADGCNINTTTSFAIVVCLFVPALNLHLPNHVLCTCMTSLFLKTRFWVPIQTQQHFQKLPQPLTLKTRRNQFSQIWLVQIPCLSFILLRFRICVTY